MTILHSIVFGVIEGVTEFLPISSTAHLLLTAHVLQLSQSEFQKTFEIVIQLGSILSVVVLYWRSLILDREVLKRVIVAFVPTAIIGLLLHKVVRNILFESEQTVLWALFLGGIVLVMFDRWDKRRDDAVDHMKQITYPQAALIGCFQAIAIIPGVSRSGATIVGGMMLGLSRTTIVDFSFVLAIPTMLAATGLDLLKTGTQFSGNEYTMLAIGFVVSFLVALAVIRWFLAYIKKHTFVPFGVYRILVALAFWFVVR